ncbi:MAG: carbamoyltransferase [Pseudomonadota bacterium]
MLILGISAYYHDSAACIVRDGVIVAAAQEERFSRKKHDMRFPSHAVACCLAEAQAGFKDVDVVAFYEKPFVKFERLLETYLTFAPKGLRSFAMAMPVWIKEKLFLKRTIERELRSRFGKGAPRFIFSTHHQAHAASAFFPSPFDEAAILCLDAVGEWTTTSAWTGRGNAVKPLWELRFPHSLGMLYSAFTYYTGFKVNSGEYKVMGLAPYGRPTYVRTILDNLIDLKPDGTFRLNMEYFGFCTGLAMTNARFHGLFGGEPRKPETGLTQKEMDLARSIQEVTEEIVMRLGRSLHGDTGLGSLCLAGGVSLNCVANGRLLREGPFKRIWIQPASGDAGGAVGAALAAWHTHFGNERHPQNPDGMKGAYLGPAFSGDEIEAFLKGHDIPGRFVAEKDIFDLVAGELSAGKVIGWFAGRMEFGPRALGARSIIGDARSAKMQSIMNLKIKHRESFRPFAPSVLRERVADYFEMDCDSPYMLLVAAVNPERRIAPAENAGNLWGIDLLNVPRSDIPAVTHIDYSARVQTVHRETNPRYWQLIKAFEKLTGCGVIVNTSFNVRGEPIVCTPEDAYRCFMRTEMDLLVMENFVLDKREQRGIAEDNDWMKEFELD